LITLFVFAVFGMALFASLVKFWPYDLSFSLRHYVLGLVDNEVGTAFVNSLTLAAFTATAGTCWCSRVRTWSRRPGAQTGCARGCSSSR
jgi:ABC-type Fe3+ transport system permease subunit